MEWLVQNKRYFVDLWIAQKKSHQLELLTKNFGAKNLLIKMEITASMM